jgi:hypothetical protein
MGLVIVVVVLFLVISLEDVFKDTYTEAKHRRDDRVMADYLLAEDARDHRYRLEAIDRAVQQASDDMARIAAEASGEIIEGTCQEVERR